MPNGRTLDCVAIIPAAGLAKRLGKPLSSKEVLPISGVTNPHTDSVRIVSDCLLQGLKEAGIEEVYWIIREGKWDIPNHYQQGKTIGLTFAYLMMGLPFGTPFSVDQAFPFVKNKRVALGFPDIQFKPGNLYTRLLEKHRSSDVDIVLAVFAVNNPAKFDMVNIDANSIVSNIVIKPEKTDLRYAWIAAIWSPKFTLYLHEFLAEKAADIDLKKQPEIYIGTVFQAAMKEGFKISAEIFPHGEALDLGTLDDFQQAANFYA